MLRRARSGIGRPRVANRSCGVWKSCADLNFSSNDYLGLSIDPRLREAVAEALAAGSRRRLDRFPPALRQRRHLGRIGIANSPNLPAPKRLLYFSSGYAANVGLFSAVLRPDDVVFSDSANHASIIDGIRLSGARKVIFPHLDLNVLEDELRQNRRGRRAEDSSPSRAFSAWMATARRLRI